MPCNTKYKSEEEKISTGLVRVVRHVDYIWAHLKEPVALRTLNKKMRGNYNLADYLVEEPLLSALFPLVKASGGMVLMPRSAWNALKVEEQAELRDRIRRPKRSTPLLKRTKTKPGAPPSKPVLKSAEPFGTSLVVTRDFRDFE